MKHTLVKSLVFLSTVPICILLIACQRDEVSEQEQPKNIIFMIGDGMGVAQLTAGKYQKGDLALERFTTTGLILTHSENAFATDSAAAGTAMATGQKTCNYMIAMDCDGNAIKTVIEWAEEIKMPTGIVVTSSVTDATPAAFTAHSKNRFRQAEIADQIADSGVDILFGGGWSYFIPKSEQGSRRNDEKDLFAQLKEKMKVIKTPEEFKTLGNDMPAVALFAPNYMDKAKNRHPPLASLVRKALAILSENENGFFLLVEGSQIDRASHDNNGSSLIDEVMDFDDAVEVALDFAGGNGKTLVVATSDHETGGFALHQGSVNDRSIAETAFTSIGHTASMVPLFAFGPGEEAFGGIHDNTFIGKTLIDYIRKESN